MSKNTLKHYGILGMKWGVRRTEQQLQRDRDITNQSKNIAEEGRKLNKTVSNIRNTSKQTDLSSMSDAELREKVNRMNMEQQYAQLSSNQIKKGHVYADSILAVAGSTLAITSSALAIALSIKQLKG